MTGAYLDSSIVTAIAFVEPGAGDLRARLQQYAQLYSAPLLEAEVRSAARREGMPVTEGWFNAITFVAPELSLRPEIIRVLDTGYVRGADCWHLATALYLSPEPEQLMFLTLDQRQRDVAGKLGFALEKFTP